MRVLGVDPSLRRTGYAVLQWNAGKSVLLASGAVANPVKMDQADCLVTIHRELSGVIEVTQPDVLAIESVIYVQSLRTAIALGSARGAVLVAARGAGLGVYEYPTREIKKAATGTGAAQKQQVGFMMRALLGLTYTPGSDEADAMAAALTHIQRHARNVGH